MKANLLALFPLFAALAAFAQVDASGFFGSASVGQGFDKGQGSKGATIPKSSMVTILILQRPLAFPVASALQSLSDGAASHVQLAAYKNDTGESCVDVGTAKPFDNFGLTGKKFSLSAVDSKILIESPEEIAREYLKTPLGEFQMSEEGYYRTRDAAFNLVKQAKYAPLNKVDLSRHVFIGSSVGGLIAGGLAGGAIAVSEYKKEGRYNPGIHENNSQQICIPEENCQFFAYLFWQLAQLEPSFKVITPYGMPGEVVSYVENGEDFNTPPQSAQSIQPEPTFGQENQDGQLAENNDTTCEQEYSIASDVYCSVNPDVKTADDSVAVDLTGCEPKEVVEKFIASCKGWITGATPDGEGDVQSSNLSVFNGKDERWLKRLASFCTPESRDALGFAVMGFASEGAGKSLALLNSVKLGNCTIDGDNATVAVEVRDFDGVDHSTELSLKKLGGVWKIHLVIGG